MIAEEFSVRYHEVPKAGTKWTGLNPLPQEPVRQVLLRWAKFEMSVISAQPPQADRVQERGRFQVRDYGDH